MSPPRHSRVDPAAGPTLADLHRTLGELECYARLTAAGGLRSGSLESRRESAGRSDAYAAVDRLSDRGDATKARRVWARLQQVAGPERRVLLWLADRGGSRPEVGTIALLFAREYGPLELREAVDIAGRAREAAVAAYGRVGPQRGRSLTTSGALSRDRMLQSVRAERATEATLRGWGLEQVGRAVAAWMSISDRKV